MLILDILFWGVALIAVTLALFLLTPWRIRLAVTTDPLRYRVTAQPFSRAFPTLPIADSSRPAKTLRKKTKPHRKRPDRARRSWGLRLNAGEILTLPHTLLDMLHAVSFEDLTLNGEFGLGDPADTGQLYGQLTPFIYGSTGLPASHVFLRPNFDRACVAGSCHAQIRLRPASFLAPLLALLWRLFRPTR